MPLLPGKQNMRKNYNELMNNVESPGRAKAIATLMTKHNISREEAMHRQALRIIQTQARKNG